MKIGIESRVLIQDYFLREVQSTERHCGGIVWPLLGINSFIAGTEYGHFGTPLIGDSEDGVMPIESWEFNNKVKGNCGKWGHIWNRVDGR